jgi:ABC-type glycerol-3-phosphate transport system substrate-binding protein
MKIKRYISIVLVLIFCILCVIFVIPTLAKKNSGGTAPDTTPTLLDIWYIEGFEGGSVSRIGWLRARCLEYEQAHKGILMCVTSYTETQAADKLAAGEKFDLISFPTGLGSALLPHLADYDGSMYGVLDNFAAAGVADNTQIAVPYMAGAYGLFIRELDKERLNIADLASELYKTSYTKKVGKNTINMQQLVYGSGAYNNPLPAVSFKPEAAQAPKTQYEAYVAFCRNRTATVLLGTQRDMYRLNNRMEQGNIEALNFVPLFGHNDLCQFMAISAATAKHSEAKSFVEFLLSDATQHKLTTVGMFSPVYRDLYTAPWYAAVEEGYDSMKVVGTFDQNK